MTKPNVSLKTMKTMKKYSILLSAAFAIFALASCQKEQEVTNTEVIDNTPKSVPFVLRANIPSVDTKTTLNTSTWAVNWEDTDVIYAVTTDEAWGEAYPVEADETIAEFAYDSVNGTFSTDKAIADGNHTFNFLYTAGQQKSYHRGASTTFQLAGAQTFDASNPTASLKLYDALAAQVEATTPTSFADVEMSHLFSLMKVTLNNKTGADVTISKFEVEIPGQHLSGIFTVNFSSTPTTTYKSGGGNKITVNISNGTVANNGSLDVYFVMGPVTGYTGEVTFTVTDSADNIYSKTNTISTPVTFAAGTYNTASYTFKAGVSYPVVDNTSSDYTTGFEDDFTAGTTYNNTAVKVDGPDGQQWGSYYGTVSTNSKLTGSNSMQMRWYTSAKSNLGYAETNFFIKKVGYVSFSAAATNDLKIGLYYKGDSDPDWTLAETFTPSTTKDTYNYGFVTPVDNARIRFQIVLPASEPTSTSNIRIDDVVVKPVAPAPSISVTTSAATSTSSAEGTTATLNGSLALLYGADNASVTEAGFYYKLTTAGSYTKVTCAAAPTSTTTFSYDLNGLTKGSEYTYYAYAIYAGGSAVNGSTKTFTPTKIGEGGGGTVTYSFAFATMGSTGWTSSYSDHDAVYDDTIVTIDIKNASKQGSTITTIPVTKAGDVIVVLKGGKTMSAVTFTLTQWTTKAKTVSLQYSTNGGTTFSALSPAVSSTTFSLTSSSLPSGTNAVKMVQGNTSNQVGIASVEFTYSD